jgi:hypothetical protein
LPDPVAGNEAIPAELAGVVSDAEAAVRALNDRSRPVLAPLARLLLRTESIASSKVEGLQVDARSLARAETQADAGRTLGPALAEVLANIDVWNSPSTIRRWDGQTSWLGVQIRLPGTIGVM